ncbi:hypothetical protein GCM10027405_38990 [Arthrobacter alkaliphilus]|uniref:hypothetical protein n=1 Tax=Arthrobacter alkaliphilus TaxID=369936 RepID=UPI001F33AE7B|nr:hypothetical protein [Arthrobacter alkaliphilus]
MTRFGISQTKFWGAALAVAVIGFLLFKPLFLDHVPPGPQPGGLQAGLFMFESALSALAMGVGVAILIFGGNVVRTLPAELQLNGRILQIALFWIVAPWLVHTGLHMTNAEGDFGRLAAIEYGFHVTTYSAGIVAAVMVARILHELVGAKRAAGPDLTVTPH